MKTPNEGCALMCLLFVLGVDWSSQDVYSGGVTITDREEDNYCPISKMAKNLLEGHHVPLKKAQ